MRVREPGVDEEVEVVRARGLFQDEGAVHLRCEDVLHVGGELGVDREVHERLLRSVPGYLEARSRSEDYALRAAVVLLQSIFHGLTGQDSALAIVLSTLAIAALFSPLRRRIQTIFDRRFYRQNYDAALSLARFARTARDEVDLDTLTGELAGVVTDTMQPKHVSFWLRRQN